LKPGEHRRIVHALKLPQLQFVGVAERACKNVNIRSRGGWNRRALLKQAAGRRTPREVKGAEPVTGQPTRLSRRGTRVNERPEASRNSVRVVSGARRYGCPGDLSNSYLGEC